MGEQPGLHLEQGEPTGDKQVRVGKGANEEMDEGANDATHDMSPRPLQDPQPFGGPSLGCSLADPLCPESLTCLGVFSGLAPLGSRMDKMLLGPAGGRWTQTSKQCEEVPWEPGRVQQHYGDWERLVEGVTREPA